MSSSAAFWKGYGGFGLSRQKLFSNPHQAQKNPGEFCKLNSICNAAQSAEIGEKSNLCRLLCHAVAKGKISQPMQGQAHGRLVVLHFKLPEFPPCRGVEHHAAVFDLIHGLSANANDFAQ